LSTIVVVAIVVIIVVALLFSGSLYVIFRAT
jgi:hypothetical protein